jgi:hypothetical protein
MNRKERFLSSLEKIAKLDQEIYRVQKETSRSEMRKRGIDPDNYTGLDVDRQAVNASYELGRKAVEPMRAEREKYAAQFFSQVPVDDFLESDPQAIDIALDILELTPYIHNVIHLTCYYYHNFYLLKLNQNHIQRLQQLTLLHCHQETREDLLGNMAQIMELHCNDDIRPKLNALTQDDSFPLVQKQAKFVLGAMDMLAAHRERGEWKRCYPLYD